jgi:hypothetical protein
VDIPQPWGVALSVSAFTAILVVIAKRRPAAAMARLVPPVTHLLAGGLIGFISLAFYPALPVVAAIGGMLATRAAQASRWTDAALLAFGFGVAWTGLIGYRMVNDALDPAVSGSDLTAWFAVGVVILVGGLVLLIGRAVWLQRLSLR